MKEKITKYREQERHEKNGSYSLPGQPAPLTVSFEELRKRALETPQLKPFTEEEVNLERHSKISDYSSSWILAIVVQVVFRDKEFFWLIESMFVSKINGNYILLDLLTKAQRGELKLAKGQALDNCGVDKAAREVKGKNKYLWEVPFSETDYQNLNPAFRQLIEPDESE